MDSQAAQAQYETLTVSYCVVLKIAVNIRHFHISNNAPYLPRKFLHNLNFSFLLRITAVPREIETMLMQILGGKWEMWTWLIKDLYENSGKDSRRSILAGIFNKIHLLIYLALSCFLFGCFPDHKLSK